MIGGSVSSVHWHPLHRNLFHASRSEAEFLVLNGYGRTGVFSISCVSYFLAFISSFSPSCITFNPQFQPAHHTTFYLPWALSTTVVYVWL